MLKNYLKTALRNIFKNKLYAAISIFGLAIGIACFILTGLFVRDELSFDKWHEKGDRIFKVEVMNNMFGFSTFPPFPYMEAIMEETAGVVGAVNIGQTQELIIKKDNHLIQEKGLYYTQSSIFDLFDFELKYGDAATALSDPKSIVLSPEMAKKYFGKENPLGETLEIMEKGLYKVAGVLEPIPGNSHLQFNFLMGYDSNDPVFSRLKTTWRFGQGVTYLLLDEGYTLSQLEADTKSVLEKNTNKEKLDSYTFHPFTDLYLTNGTVRGSSRYSFGGDIKYVYIFGSVGLIILLVACFNYVNMSTAWGLARVKEVGIRKTIGAYKKQLIAQFLSESLVITLISVVLAIVIVEGALPAVNALIGKQLVIDYFGSWQIPVFLTGTIAVVGFSSGFYPALVLSSHKVTSLVKGPTTKGGWLRKGLIVLQFTGCAGLLMATLVIKKQLNFLQDKDLGFNGEQVLNLNIDPLNTGDVKYLDFKTEIERLSYVTEVSGSPLPGVSGIVSLNDVEGIDEKVNMIPFFMSVDANLPHFFEMELVEGEGFNELLKSEENQAILVNEAFVKEVGWTTAVGKKIDNWKVVGVMKNFHFMSAKEEIKPLMMTVNPDAVQAVHLRFRPENTTELLTDLESIWGNLIEARPFDYLFMNQAFAASYEKERKVAQLFDRFSVLILVISCAGLFSLTAFISEQRKKEIGIRKILGAGLHSIFALLANRFLLQIFIAIAVALPIAYFVTEQWLSSFPYRVEFGVAEGLIGFATLTIVSLLTISYHGIKSGLTKPVDAIRYE